MTLLDDGWDSVLLGNPERGKLTDSQDSLLFRFRRIDPRRENFTLSATFIVEDPSGADFQTGYGIAVVDTIASANNQCRHRNHLLLGRFRALDGRNYALGLRVVGGYTNPRAIQKGGRRRLDPSRLFPTQNADDAILKGDRHRFTLVKDDDGFEASVETSSGTEKIVFPGCDFLLGQDRRWVYVGFAQAGDLGLRITDVSFETSPGRLSRTPKEAIGSYVPDYPFSRTLLDGAGSDGEGRVSDSVLRVSPSGPLTLAEAISKAGPGSEIILADGVYTDGPYYIPPLCSGEPRHRISLRAEHPGKAVLDGSAFKAALPALTLRGRFWTVEGLVFRNAPSSGLFICGSDNEVSGCEACFNGDTGILICSFPGTSMAEWPERNRVSDCLSHDNCDKVRCNADGFGAKLSIGRGNGFYSCRAFHNIDDGFDLYTKYTLGPIGPVVMESCEAAFNGWLSDEERPEGVLMTGNGFKLGGERQRVRHVLRDCTAHDNASAGFNSNSNPSPVLRRCEARDNSQDFK